ncbi:hypothetical protein CsatB_027835 [Cannabis sativa]
MDSEESNRLLLVKKEEEEEERGYYDEKCPGCIVDNMKKSNSTIPFKHLFFVFLLALAAALPITSMFPFMYFMIRDFGIAKKEEDIGYYAGFLGCAFLLGRGLTSILWGITADRYGRKPVMLCGIIAVVIFNTFFGLSINYWMALSTRFLLGSMCGILGSMMAYISEICRKEYQALGISMLSTAWGIGLVIGPALGGFLAQETLHFHTKNDEEKENYDGPKEDLLEEDEKKSKQSLLKNWPLMSSIMLYCVFQLHDMAYVEIFPLWAVSPKKYGGLSYSSDDIGEILALAGFVMLVFQLFLYPPIERIFGPVHLARIGAGQSQRGAANGMSMAAMSLFKAAGPAGGGAIFAWVQNHQNALFLPGDHMVFFILNVIEFIALIMTFKPFLALTNNDVI